MAAHASTTPHPEVMATKPARDPFIACNIEKEGSPVLRSTRKRFVNSAVMPPAAPESAVLAAAIAATSPTFSIPRTKADPGLKPNPIDFENEI